MTTMPRFVAAPEVCFEDETLETFGVGDTPESAIAEFKGNGEMDSYLSGFGKAPNTITVLVYSCARPEDSDWPQDEINPDWEWCAHELVRTVVLEVSE